MTDFPLTEPSLEDMKADMEARAALATTLMDADPKLTFISALIIAGDKLAIERSKKWLAEGMDYELAENLVGSFGRLDFAIWAMEQGHVTRDYLLDNLPGLWSGSDPGGSRHLPLWLEAWERNGRSTITDGKPLRRTGLITIYRGQDAWQPMGIAWTLEQRVAQKFARGAATRQHNRPGGIVLKARVRRDQILAYLTGRGEAEVIVDPRGWS